MKNGNTSPSIYEPKKSRKLSPRRLTAVAALALVAGSSAAAYEYSGHEQRPAPLEALAKAETKEEANSAMDTNWKLLAKKIKSIGSNNAQLPIHTTVDKHSGAKADYTSTTEVLTIENTAGFVAELKSPGRQGGETDVPSGSSLTVKFYELNPSDMTLSEGVNLDVNNSMPLKPSIEYHAVTLAKDQNNNWDVTATYGDTDFEYNAVGFSTSDLDNQQSPSFRAAVVDQAYDAVDLIARGAEPGDRYPKVLDENIDG